MLNSTFDAIAATPDVEGRMAMGKLPSFGIALTDRNDPRKGMATALLLIVASCLILFVGAELLVRVGEELFSVTGPDWKWD